MKITENYFENGRYNLTLDLSTDEFDSMFVRCNECNRIVLRDDEDTLEHNGYHYCGNCTFECSDCGEILPIDYSYSVEDSSSLYCESCFNNDTYRCSGCGRHYRYEDSLHYCEYNDADYCDDCYDNRERVLDDYHSFKDYGEIRFLGTDGETQDNTIFMGYELEVDSNEYVELSSIVETVKGLVPHDFYHYEHDGSLNNGFEMISQPCSLSYLLSLTETHKDVFRELINTGLRGHDICRCGLHIHLNKRFFGYKLDSSIAKLLYIFEKYSDELLKFSRRTRYQVEDWCKFRKTDITSPKWIKNTVKDAKGYLPHDERYHAINLTNRETIEIRLWRSSLNINTFIATLKFTARLANIVKDTPATKLARMSFLDLLGDDEDILKYWSRVCNRNEEQQEDM